MPMVNGCIWYSTLGLIMQYAIQCSIYCYFVGRSYHPAPFSLSGDGQRQLRSLERLLLPAEAAGLFVVEPADTRQATTETPPPLPQGKLRLVDLAK